jgi:Acyl-CoA dehydrogenase, N-terminal domain
MAKEVKAGLLDDVRRVVNEQLMPHDRQIEQTGRIPEDALDAIRKMGLFGCCTPVRYGGLGLDLLDTSTVIEEIASAYRLFLHLQHERTYRVERHRALRVRTTAATLAPRSGQRSPDRVFRAHRGRRRLGR